MSHYVLLYIIAIEQLLHLDLGLNSWFGFLVISCWNCLNSLVLLFQGKYNNWDKVDPAELFSKAPTEKKEANPKLNMVKFLQVGFRSWPSNWFSEHNGAYCFLFDQLEVSVLCLVSLDLTSSFCCHVRWKPKAVTTWFCGWTVIKKARTSVLR